MGDPSSSENVYDVAKLVEAAVERTRGLLRRTPLERAFWLEADDLEGCKVFLKLESQQRTKSFKFRGAMNKIQTLHAKERAKGIVTASTGNHALAVATACSIVQMNTSQSVSCEIFLPKDASTAKVENLRTLGVPIVFHGSNCLAAELEARKTATEEGKVFISPYNDLEVIAGQGTAGFEILEQLKEENVDSLDAIFVPVGGGGLIGGIASFVKHKSPKTLVFGCSPKNDAHMARSIAKGEILQGSSYLEDSGETLSEGTAGAVENCSVTFEICKKYVDEWIELTEEEIGKAVFKMLDKQHEAVEGAAGLGIAAFEKKREEMKGKNVVIVICGGNVKTSVLKALLIQYLPN